MSTTIKGVVGGGLTFTASPATEIVIPTGYLVDRSNDDNSITEYITIPNGVKAIEVYAAAHITDNTDHLINLYISSNKSWFCSSGYMEIDGTVYVGVTPNKRYTVYVDTKTRDGEDCRIDRFYIKYSLAINNKTPTVTDY